MEYYAALKRSELLKHTWAWMNLKNIMQRKLSQSQEVRTALSPLTRKLYSSQTHEFTEE